MEYSIAVETPTLLEGESEETLLPESEYSESFVVQFLNRAAKILLLISLSANIFY